MKRDWHTMEIDELSAILETPPTLVDAELALCELGDRIRLRELNAIPEDIHQLLVEHLGAPDPVVQLEAAIVLAELADTRAISVLVSATKKRKHRLEALRAMAKIKHPDITAALESWLGRFWGHWADKLQAAASLASQGNESALEYLRARCLSRKPLERCSALELLGESRHPKAVESLQEYLSDPARPEWLSAARGLAMHRSPEAKIRLKSALGSVDAELRGSVMDWLNERHLSLEVEAQSKEVG